MDALSTTKLSSRGQVVIPEEVRTRLRLAPRVRFIVVGEGDVVILKRIEAPSIGEFDDLIRQARRQARRVGMKSSDIAEAVEAVRGRR